MKCIKAAPLVREESSDPGPAHPYDMGDRMIGYMEYLFNQAQLAAVDSGAPARDRIAAIIRLDREKLAAINGISRTFARAARAIEE